MAVLGIYNPYPGAERLRKLTNSFTSHGSWALRDVVVTISDPEGISTGTSVSPFMGHCPLVKGLA